MMRGPGRIPWMSMAPSNTAAGAEPGIARVNTGIIAPGTQALFPVSEAMSPSIEPLPNISLSAGLAPRFAKS